MPDGLASQLRERGANLSSGERQLLAVARVALRDPAVLVMDEATAFMDPSTEATLQRDLGVLLQGRTAVVIAHRLATVEAADRILVLQKGRLVEQGNHRELRAAGGFMPDLPNCRSADWRACDRGPNQMGGQNHAQRRLTEARASERILPLISKGLNRHGHSCNYWRLQHQH